MNKYRLGITAILAISICFSSFGAAVTAFADSSLSREETPCCVSPAIPAEIEAFETDYLAGVAKACKVSYAKAKVTVLYDFNNNPRYSLVEYLPEGYMITDRLTGSILERCPTSPSPYSEYKTLTKYYGGAEEYYVYSGGKYLNLLYGYYLTEDSEKTLQKNSIEINERLTTDSKISSREEFKEKYIGERADADNAAAAAAVMDAAEESQLAAYTTSSYTNPDGDSVTDHLISNSSFFETNYYVHENTDGTCAQVALAALICYYADIVDSAFLTNFDWGITVSSSVYNIYLATLFSQGYITSLAGFSQAIILMDRAETVYRRLVNLSSGALSFNSAKSLMNAYIDAEGLSASTTQSTIYCTRTFVKNCVTNNIPCYLHSYQGNDYYFYYSNGVVQSSLSSNHAMVAYGYTTVGSGTAASEYICYFGHRVSGSFVYNKVYVSRNLLDAAFRINY